MGGRPNYYGLETGFTKRFDQGYQLSATYTVGESEACSPSPVDDAFPVPRDIGNDCWLNTLSDGGPGHQRHRAVFNGVVDLGYDFQLSGLYFFGSGQRFPTYVTNDLRDTGGYFTTAASGNRLLADGTIIGHSDVGGDPIHRVDVRLMRRFNLGQVQVDGIVEVFNLFNHENYGLYQGNFLTGARYGTPIFGPGRRLLPSDRAAGVPGRLLSRAPGV